MNMKQHYRWHIYRVRTWKCIHITISFDASYVRGNWRGNSCWNVSVFTSQYSIKVWPLVHELEKISKYIYIYIYIFIIVYQTKVFFFFFLIPYKTNLYVEKVEIQFQCHHFGPLELKKDATIFYNVFLTQNSKVKIYSFLFTKPIIC